MLCSALRGAFPILLARPTTPTSPHSTRMPPSQPDINIPHHHLHNSTPAYTHSIKCEWHSPHRKSTRIMFYSHEGTSSLTLTRHHTRSILLTRSRSPNIAQIWRCNRLVSISPCCQGSNMSVANCSLTRLVATLGSKSTLKNVSRKAILEVDVVKTCGTIIEPAAPMALRLSSNLL